MIQAILDRCGHFAVRRYRVVLGVAFFLTVLSLLPPILSGPKFSVSLRKMLPAGHPASEAFGRAVEDFGSADEALVVFRLRNNADLAAVGSHVDALAARLAATGEFQDAYCRFLRADEKDFLETELRHRGLIFLPESGLDEAAAELTPKAITRSIRRTAQKLQTPGTAAAEKALLLDPLNLAPVYHRHAGFLFDQTNRKETNGYIASVGPSDTLLLLIVQPYGPAQRLEYSQRIMTLLAKEVDGMIASMPPALRAGVTADYAGGYEVARRYTAHLRQSLIWSVITSLIGVLVLFGISYRRYGVMMYVGIPLIMVVTWTIGLGWLVFGKLDMVSSAFAAVLVGLGVDYGIHIYNRYVEERMGGMSVEDSFAEAMSHTGYSVVIGMTTTAFSFLALCVSRFGGLANFGILAAMGLVLAVPAMVFVLPAIVVWRSKRGQGEPLRALRPTFFGLRHLGGIIERHYRVIATGCLSLAFVCGVYALFGHHLGGHHAFRFDERLSSLRPKQDPVFRLQEEVAARFSKKSPVRLMLLTIGDTEAEAMNRADGLLQKLEALKNENIISDYECPLRFLPAPAEQQRRLEALKMIDFAAAEEAARMAVERSGIEPSAFRNATEFLAQHRELVERGVTVTPTAYEKTPAWKMLKRFVAQRKTTMKLLEIDQKALAAHPMKLAWEPLSRYGERYFVPGATVTQAGLEYLRGCGVTAISVRSAGSAELHASTGSDGGEATMLSTTTTLGQSDAYVLADYARATDGSFLLDGGTLVTPAMVDFLLHSNCKEISVLQPGWTVQSSIFPKATDLNELNFSDAWLNTLHKRLGVDNQTIMLTGSMVVAHDLAQVVKEDFLLISLSVGGISLLVLLLIYRSVWRVLLMVLPIVLALCFMFGIMNMFNCYFNFINVLVVPVIIGLGVDNGVHLVHRFYECGRLVRPVVVDTGRAIFVTNLTSMIGFGSLLFGSYTGIRSMGMLSVLGLGMLLISSLVVLPSVLMLFARKGELIEHDGCE